MRSVCASVRREPSGCTRADATSIIAAGRSRPCEFVGASSTKRSATVAARPSSRAATLAGSAGAGAGSERPQRPSRRSRIIRRSAVVMAMRVTLTGWTSMGPPTRHAASEGRASSAFQSPEARRTTRRGEPEACGISSAISVVPPSDSAMRNAVVWPALVMRMLGPVHATVPASTMGARARSASSRARPRTRPSSTGQAGPASRSVGPSSWYSHTPSAGSRRMTVSQRVHLESGLTPATTCVKPMGSKDANGVAGPAICEVLRGAYAHAVSSPSTMARTSDAMARRACMGGG